MTEQTGEIKTFSDSITFQQLPATVTAYRRPTQEGDEVVDYWVFNLHQILGGTELPEGSQTEIVVTDDKRDTVGAELVQRVLDYHQSVALLGKDFAANLIEDYTETSVDPDKN